MEELLQKLILKVYQINKNTKHDVFLSFSGHVNTFDVNYHKNGWCENNKPIILALDEKLTCENVTRVINELEKLEKGDDINV